MELCLQRDYQTNDALPGYEGLAISEKSRYVMVE